jgi:hypothetical protein
MSVRPAGLQVCFGYEDMRSACWIGIGGVLLAAACGGASSDADRNDSGPSSDAGVDVSASGGSSGQSGWGGTGISGSGGFGQDGRAGTGGGAGQGGSAGQCAPTATCAGYCAHLAAAGCQFDSIPPGEVESSCLADCSETHGYIPASCDATFLDFLECASCASFECPGEKCINDGSVCVDTPLEVLGCNAEESALQACAGSCLKSPIVEGGSDATGSFQYQTSRCECPAPPAPGKAPGEACSGFGQCAAICCDCPSGHGNYLVQRCAQGICTSAASACANALGNSFIADFCSGA